VTASGALVTLEKPAILKLHYDQALVAGAPAGLGIYRWDPNTDQWQWVPGRIDAGQAAVVASVSVLGTYALLAPAGLPPMQRVLLPLVLKDLH